MNTGKGLLGTSRVLLKVQNASPVEEGEYTEHSPDIERIRVDLRPEAIPFLPRLCELPQTGLRVHGQQDEHQMGEGCKVT